jgi:hypothetical protein
MLTLSQYGDEGETLHLGAQRGDTAVLQGIREIGGEQYMWEFSTYISKEQEVSAMPPTPTIRFG